MKTRGKKAKEVKLPKQAERYLNKIANSGKSERRYSDRAKIVLRAHIGQTNLAISKQTGIGEKTVIKWRTRWSKILDELQQVEEMLITEKIKRSEYEKQIDKWLSDEARSGRPGTFKAEQINQIMALACDPATNYGYPFEKWTTELLVLEAKRQGIVETISVSYVTSLLKISSLTTTQR